MGIASLYPSYEEVETTHVPGSELVLAKNV